MPLGQASEHPQLQRSLPSTAGSQPYRRKEFSMASRPSWGDFVSSARSRWCVSSITSNASSNSEFQRLTAIQHSRIDRFAQYRRKVAHAVRSSGTLNRIAGGAHFTPRRDTYTWHPTGDCRTNPRHNQSIPRMSLRRVFVYRSQRLERESTLNATPFRAW